MSKRLYNVLRSLTKDEILKLSLKRCTHGHTFIEHPKCFERDTKIERIGFLDIEASNLKADFGYVISYCIKELDGPIDERLITEKELRSKTKDKDLIEQLISDMRKYTRIITYYGSGFDIPFIRTRATMWELEFPLHREMYHTDAYFIIRNRFNLHRKKMETACSFFNIPCKQHPIVPGLWQDAMTGQKEALQYILEHNREDVISLELLFKRIENYTGINKTSI